MAITLSKIQSSLLKLLMTVAATFISINGAAQTNTSKIKDSIFQIGNNNTATQNTRKTNNYYTFNNYTDINLKNATDELLANHLKFISDANAEKAERNGQYILASEIYEQLYESFKKLIVTKTIL